MSPESSRWRYHKALVGLRCTDGDRPQPARGVERALADEELQVLAVLAAGATQETAGRQLGLSPRTVRRRVEAVRTRLSVATSIEAIAWAARQKLL